MRRFRGSWRLCSTTLVRGVSGELDDENWRLCSTTLVRGVSVELEAENWRLSSTTLVRGAICAARSWYNCSTRSICGAGS